MSYPTAQRLQYGVTPAQESASVRPHVLLPKQCNLIFPRHRKPTGLRLAGPVDSCRRGHRMLDTCRPEKAARFVFPGLVVDAIAPMRASRPDLTFSDRHDQERDIASASRIRQGRPRLRA